MTWCSGNSHSHSDAAVPAVDAAAAVPAVDGDDDAAASASLVLIVTS